MNKNYRSVYNEALGSWVAVSELDSEKGKSSSGGLGNLVESLTRFGGQKFKLKALFWSLIASVGLASTTPVYAIVAVTTACPAVGTTYTYGGVTYTSTAVVDIVREFNYETQQLGNSLKTACKGDVN